MNTALIPFAYQDCLVRSVMRHGEPWFVGKDVCGALELKNPRTSLALLDDDEKGGRAAAEFPDELVFALLKAGFSTDCYDGQYFFDVDHPVVGADKVERSVSNLQAGNGPEWFLLDTRRALRPIIFQDRKKPKFVAKDREDDDNVFERAEFVYGVDTRCAVGFGFWQMAFGSRADLNEANLQAAYTAMTTLRGDEDRALGIKPNLLVVHPNLKFKADELLKAQNKDGGKSNIMQGLVEAFDSPWLA